MGWCGKACMSRLLAVQMPRPGGDRAAPKEFYTRVNNRHANPPSASSAFAVSPAGDCPVLPAQACTWGLHAGRLGWIQARPGPSTCNEAAGTKNQVDKVDTGRNGCYAVTGKCSTLNSDGGQLCCKNVARPPVTEWFP